LLTSLLCAGQDFADSSSLISETVPAYVFTETGGAWKQVAELKGSDTVAGNAFGYSVAISGTTAVVGADAHADGAGRAYLFTETSGWK
jgi:nucleoside-specific outer membrane channel protein Tsx